MADKSSVGRHFRVVGIEPGYERHDRPKRAAGLVLSIVIPQQDAQLRERAFVRGARSDRAYAVPPPSGCELCAGAENQHPLLIRHESPLFAKNGKQQRHVNDQRSRLRLFPDWHRRASVRRAGPALRFHPRARIADDVGKRTRRSGLEAQATQSRVTENLGPESTKSRGHRGTGRQIKRAGREEPDDIKFNARLRLAGALRERGSAQGPHRQEHSTSCLFPKHRSRRVCADRAQREH